MFKYQRFISFISVLSNVGDCVLIYSEIFFKLMYIIVYINVERDEGPERKRELMKN